MSVYTLSGYLEKGSGVVRLKTKKNVARMMRMVVGISTLCSIGRNSAKREVLKARSRKKMVT